MPIKVFVLFMRSKSWLKYTLFQNHKICRCYNEIMFLDVLAQAAREKCGLTREDPLLVGVSGGVDSLALLVGLDELGYSLVVAHLDHGLRPESAEDAGYVSALTEKRGLSFVSARVDVGRYAADQGLSIEEAAREARYRFLFDQARRVNAQAVAVAHHADDQVETVLMHFLRGAGLPGLSGMDPRRTLAAYESEIPLVRPLLEVWREEIEVYVAEAGLEPRMDISNRDTTYFRNRLRHVLLPELETYNPQIRQVLMRMSKVLGEEDRTLRALAAEGWEVCFIKESVERVQLDGSAFRALPTALQRRVLRRAIDRLRPTLRDIGFDTVERGLAFIQAPSESGEIDLAARLNLAVIGDRLIVKTWEADLPDWEKPLLVSKDQTVALAPGEAAPLRHGWRIEAEVITELPEDLLGAVGEIGPMEAWLDADMLSLPLLVRGRKPGERWQPLGMRGHTQSLQDFFINEKVPTHLRDVWPLVCSGDEAAWVAGLRPSEGFKVQAGTQKVMHLRLVQDGGRKSVS
jgi:tRNA(Ile)-lysidine synthase